MRLLYPKGDALRAEGLLNDAIQNLAEKQCFDLSTPAQRARYRAACRACADSYTALAAATGSARCVCAPRCCASVCPPTKPF
ncbi:hypothetical protein NIA69_21565 [Gemmiger formicilis]|nr:hypothetical protein [Gemmiger formicilis]